MSDSNCPFCHHPTDGKERRCPNCGVDLALSTVIMEHAIYNGHMPALEDFPVAPELLVPRLGERLVEKSVISDNQLHAALAFQKEQGERGRPVLIGQALLMLDLVDQFTLDKTITEQILQLQEALKEANLELENRVNSRTKDLQNALNSLTELNQLKVNFLSNISHELRTPLTQIKGYTDLLNDGSLGSISDEQKDALSIMDRAIEQLENLINDLIKFASTSKGPIKLRLVRVSVNDLIRQTGNRMREWAESKNVVFEARETEEEFHVLADRDNISWVLRQLIDNAIKFTPEGGQVSLSAQRDGESLRFSIRDNGTGIHPENVEEIFEAFHQLDGSNTRKHGGTGLGLALAKEIILAHNSDIQVDSRPAEGSEFSFSLPIMA